MRPRPAIARGNNLEDASAHETPVEDAGHSGPVSSFAPATRMLVTPPRPRGCRPLQPDPELRPDHEDVGPASSRQSRMHVAEDQDEGEATSPVSIKTNFTGISSLPR